MGWRRHANSSTSEGDYTRLCTSLGSSSLHSRWTRAWALRSILQENGLATVVQLQPRKNRCWITSFVEATDHLDSPQLFRKWAAINALSAALERKVFLRVQHRQLFANLYTLLVGPPGVGKTTAIEFARAVFDLSRLQLAPPKVTRESLSNSSLVS
jgi:hypothetical protein